MPKSLQLNLPPSPLPNDSRSFGPSETSRKSLKDWQEIPAKALGRSGVSNKAAALSMEKSESWLSRALRGLEKLGWNDIGAIEDEAFWGELLDLVAEYRGVSFGGNEQDRKDAEVGRRVREMFALLKP